MKVKGMFKEHVSLNETSNYFVGQFKGDSAKEVLLIEYHEPKGEGDKHYCDVYFSSGKITRFFNPDTVDFR